MSPTVGFRAMSVALLICGALLIAYGAGVESLIPLVSGLVAGAGGLALWHRGGAGGQEARIRRLEEGLDALREETGRNREEVERLTEEREFLRELYPET